MAKLVIQLIDDVGIVQREMIVIQDATIEKAEQAMEELADGLECSIPVHDGYVTEFHYQDGDVGACGDIHVAPRWTRFTKTHPPSHIVIRPDTEEGQELSNRLHSAIRD